MKNLNLKSGFVFIFIVCLTTSIVEAQDSDIFLTNFSRRNSLINPFFFRAGFMSGVLMGGGTTSTIGLRTEYGLSKIFSVVGDAQMNRGNNAFSGGQGTLAMRYVPFDFKRFQPYVSVGFGVGSGIPGHRRHCHHQQVQTSTSTQTSGEITVPVQEVHHRLIGLALLQIGTNFKVSSHFVAQAEALFQMQLSRHPEAGGIGVRMGMAYQFGKN